MSALWQDYHPKLVAYLGRKVSADQVDDLASQTFVKAMEAMHAGKGPRDNVAGWLYRIAHNLMVDHYRVAGRQPTVDLDAIAEVHDDAQVEEVVERADLHRRLHHALAGLPDTQATAIEMQLNGHSTAEIAQHLGKTVGAVKALHHRGRESLRGRLTDPLPPVRDCEGHIVWRVRVTPDEMTCLDCGEVATRAKTPGGVPTVYCPRCTDDEPNASDDDTPDSLPPYMRPQRLVPTTSYLREGEWTR